MLADVINGVQHLGIPVCEIEQAALWYEDKLGFQRIHEKSVFYPVRLDILFMEQKGLVVEFYKPAQHLLSEVRDRGAGVIDHFALDAPNFRECATAVYKKGASLDESTPDGCVLYDHIGEKGVRGINFVGPNKEVIELCHDYNHAYGKEIGLQGWAHLAIKIADLKKSLAFYEKLGFRKLMDGYVDTPTGRLQLGFIGNHGFVIELIQVTSAQLPELRRRGPGRLDHIALDVSDVKAAFYESKKEGLSVIDTTIHELPLFDHGVRYFTISGPDGERIELNEKVSW